MSQPYRKTPMPKPKMIFDERKLNLTAPPIQKGGRPASLAAQIYRNNIQLTVFPNADNGSGVNMISGGMDLHTARLLARACAYLADENTPPDQFEMDCNVEIPREERTDPKNKMRVKSRIRVGKNDDGHMYIGVIDSNQNAPKILFKFGLSYYHQMRRKSEGGEMDKAMLSRWAALDWFDMIISLADVTLSVGAMGLGERHAPKDQGNGGGNSYGNNNGGGYGNNGGGGYGGGAKKATSSSYDSGFDDGDFDD